MVKIVEYQDDEVDLMGNKGKLCSKCKSIDFLPFKCNNCNNWFCESCFNEHKGTQCYKSTEPVVNELPQCPICNQYIKLDKSRSPDDCVDRHISSNCKVGIAIKKIKKNKCSHKKCNNIVDVFSYKCNNCFKKFCIEHRFHDCKSN